VESVIEPVAEVIVAEEISAPVAEVTLSEEVAAQINEIETAQPTAEISQVEEPVAEITGPVNNSNVEFEITNISETNEEPVAEISSSSEENLVEKWINVAELDSVAEITSEPVAEIKSEEPVAEISNEPFLVKKEETVAELNDKVAEKQNEEELAKKMQTEELQKKAQERIQRLKELSLKLKTPQGLNEMEHEPAYKRRNIALDNVPHSSESQVSRYTLSENDEKKVEIKPNNSFLHDNVD
jgi:cell division protein FtsZ